MGIPLTRSWSTFGAAAALMAVFAGPALAASTLTVSTSEVTSTTARVSWTQTSDWCFAQYRLQHRPLAGGGWQDDATYASPTTTATTVRGLEPATAYEVRVVDEDCAGSQPSAPAQFTTAAPAAGASSFAATAVFLIAALVILGFVLVGAYLVMNSRREPEVPAPPPLAQPAAAPPAPAADVARFCSSCGSPLLGPFCNKCGQYNA